MGDYSETIIPTSKEEVEKRGWDYLDVILFSGDAYVDHPSFGVAVVARLLEKYGLRVAVVPQPNWRDDLRDFKKLGRPRLFFGVTSGNMDSMVNHYTANKRLRSDDAYTPGGKAGFRPDYAVIVYCRILKQLFPDIPIVIGGIEASLRRYTHYDYWSDALKPSILIESKADMLIYGMAEKPLKELIKRLNQGIEFKNMKSLEQTAVFVQKSSEIPSSSYKTIYLNSYEECLISKKAFAENFCIIEEESNKMVASRIIEPYRDGFVVVNPPFAELSQDEIDEPYELPYTRQPHPRYSKKGPIPAFEMIKNSVNIHRGCFGGCSFCTISMHQGKFIQSRSEASILKEIDILVKSKNFNGTLTDLGGPSANMYRMQGKNLEICKKCKRPSCIFPAICKNLNTDHQPLISLYEKVRNKQGIKHVYIGSGIRYDLLFNDNHDPNAENERLNYLTNLVKYHISGRLKIAPEHSSSEVLNLMRKPSFTLFKKFVNEFNKICKTQSKPYYIVPYFISSHPGCNVEDMAHLAYEMKIMNLRVEQVQDFTPTPMTLSSCIFYTGFDPYSGKKVYVPRTLEEKKVQQKFFFWYKTEVKNELRRTLSKFGKENLWYKIYGR